MKIIYTDFKTLKTYNMNLIHTIETSIFMFKVHLCLCGSNNREKITVLMLVSTPNKIYDTVSRKIILMSDVIMTC